MEGLVTQSALIIVDMQNEFIKPEGFLGREGDKLGFKRELLAQVVPAVERLLQAGRKSTIPVVHVYTAWMPDYSDRAIPMLIPQAREAKLFVEGTWGAEIIEELTPREGEHTVLKKSYGAFFQTPLDRILRNRTVTTLIICGILTNLCVETTIREAVSLGYDIILVSDATATVNKEWHQVTIQTTELFFGRVCQTEDIVRDLARFSHDRGKPQ